MAVKTMLALATLAALGVSCATGDPLRGDVASPRSPQVTDSPTAHDPDLVADTYETGDDTELRSGDECPRFVPSVLPNGEDPGDASVYPPDDPSPYVDKWGTGKDRVVIVRGREMFGLFDGPAFVDPLGLSFDAGRFPSEERPAVEVGGVVRVVSPGPAIEWVDDGCPYRMRVGDPESVGDHTLMYDEDDLLVYAERF